MDSLLRESQQELGLLIIDVERKDNVKSKMQGKHEVDSEDHFLTHCNIRHRPFAFSANKT